MVLLIKMRDLTGHDVKLHIPAIQASPFWWTVTGTQGSDHPSNIGRAFYLFGRKVRADGTPSTSRARHPLSVHWVFPREVTAVRRTGQAGGR